MPSEWYVSSSGRECIWCAYDNPDYEPADSDDAHYMLCRGHYAEYEGESLASLDRREADEHADMSNLGMFDH